MPTGCSMNIMMEAMPDRTFDVGIAEGHAVTFSGGMAKDGLQPFCNIYSAFAQRAYDNIIHDVALLRLPVVICLDRAGLVGEDGPTHHGAFDLAALRPIPNLTIASPMDEHELRRLMYTAQLPDKGPFVIRYPRGGGVLKDWRCPFEEIKVGTGRKLRDGSDVAVLSIGDIGNDVAKAIDGTHLRRPLRHALPEAPRRGHPARGGPQVQAHRHRRERRAQRRTGKCRPGVDERPRLSVSVTRLGLPDDHFVEHGTVAELKHIVGIDAESIKQQSSMSPANRKKSVKS